MKLSIQILSLFSVLFAVSCSNNDDMLTVINADGSCYREFTSQEDSTFMVGASKKNNFPVDMDSSWNVNWAFMKLASGKDYPLKPSKIDSIFKNSPDSVVHTLFTVHIRKDYKSVEDMATSFKLKSSHKWSSFKVNYSLERKFRWFYTYFNYRETYPKIKTNFNLPIENYMSKDEARFWFTGQPNILIGMNGLEIREYMGTLEQKYNLWFGQNIWNNEYKVLLKNYDLVKKKPVSKDSLEALRDTISSTIESSLSDFKMGDILNKYFKTKAFSVLWDKENSPMKEYETEFINQDFIEYLSYSFNYKLKMPGTTIQPNNAVLNDGILSYKLTAYRMLYNDYTIEAESRKTNIWAFILTGIILIIAVGSFIYKPKKKW